MRTHGSCKPHLGVLCTQADTRPHLPQFVRREALGFAVVSMLFCLKLEPHDVWKARCSAVWCGDAWCDAVRELSGVETSSVVCVSHGNVAVAMDCMYLEGW